MSKIALRIPLSFFVCNLSGDVGGVGRAGGVEVRVEGRGVMVLLGSVPSLFKTKGGRFIYIAQIWIRSCWVH